MNKIKKISIIGALLLISSSIPNKNTIIEASETAKTGDLKGYEYFYEDSYFENDATIYNPSLATISYFVSDSSNAVEGANNIRTADNAIAFLGDLGFECIKTNESYKSRPSRDSMGVLCAQKKLNIEGKDTILVAIVPRSTGYESEWASNFTLGESGESLGFKQAGEIVYNFANEYVLENVTYSNIKIWITGYSRGGAATNIAAERFDEAKKIGNYTISKQNIYAYTFESPNTANIDTYDEEKSKINHNNIFNVINPSDIVPYVGPRAWGFYRYGIDIELCPATKNEYNKEAFDLMYQYSNDSCKKLYNEWLKYEPIGLNINAKSLANIALWNNDWELPSWDLVVNSLTKSTDVTYNEFISNFVDCVADAIGSRKIYANEYQNLLRIIMSENEGHNYESEKYWLFFSSLIENLQENIGSLSAAFILKNAVSINKLFTNIVKQTLEDAGLDSDDYTSLSNNIMTLVPLVSASVYDAILSGYGDELVNFLNNIAIVFNFHYPIYNFAWVIAKDPNYNSQSSNLIDEIINNANVSKVDVNVVKKTNKTKFLKISSTVYEFSINPTCNANVNKISYNTYYSSINSYNVGNSFTFNIKIKNMNIKIVDANGKLTNWNYNGSTTKLK